MTSSETAPQPEPAVVTMRIVITGRVQGVGYRAWLQEEAMELQLSGWVRNRTDGSVEALVHGDRKKVDDLIRACHSGPTLSRVDKVTAEPAKYDGQSGFRIERTL